MTGSSVLLACLKQLGADCFYYVPNRLEEGYGLNAEAIRTLAARGASLIISVDCGIGSCAEADLARELGVETMIGSSGRVFPRDLKAAPLLRAWVRRLRQLGVE